MLSSLFMEPGGCDSLRVPLAAVSRLLELDVMAVDLEAELDGLYLLSPGDFVAARDELARRLREEGERRAR